MSRRKCPECGRALDGIMSASPEHKDLSLRAMARGEGEWWQCALLWALIGFVSVIALACVEAAL